MNEDIHYIYIENDTETTRLDNVFDGLFEQAEKIIRAEPLEPTV